MSRIDDYEPDDTASFLRMCSFTHNIEQAVKGKRGLKFFQELEAALVALPEKWLASGVMADADENSVPLGTVPEPTGEVCALGAVAVARMVAAGIPREEALKKLVQKFDPSEQNWELQKMAAAELKISHPLAYAVIYRNDECSAKDGHQRYEKVLSWVRSKLSGSSEFYP